MAKPIDVELLNHPYWKITDPAVNDLIWLSAELPPELNPFESVGVVMVVAGVPGAYAEHSKTIIGREGVKACIETGLIHRKDPATGKPTIVTEATSANTGQSMAGACAAMEIPFLPIMKSDTPQTKVDALKEKGGAFVLEPDMHADLSETTVQKARRLGRQPGWCNPDQYGSDWNWKAQARYLAPALFAQFRRRYQTVPRIIAAPAGTMGTTYGLAAYAQDAGYETRVLPVLCLEKQEVPGARPLSSIEKDIMIPWRQTFGERIEFGPRYESFLLSYLASPLLPRGLGPSFGLGFYGALSFLWKHMQEGTLDLFRDGSGTIHVVLFGPDSDRLYEHLYRAVLLYEDYAERRPVSLERLFGKAA